MSDKIEIKLPYRTSGHLFPEIVCKDGFMMSVQASDRHRCCPKTLDFFKLSCYSEVEVGFPSATEELLMPYQVSEGSNVFGYVPLKVVQEIIRKHGGTVCLKCGISHFLS